MKTSSLGRWLGCVFTITTTNRRGEISADYTEQPRMGANRREGNPVFTTETQRARRIPFEFGFQTLRTLCLYGEIFVLFASIRGYSEPPKEVLTGLIDPQQLELYVDDKATLYPRA